MIVVTRDDGFLMVELSPATRVAMPGMAARMAVSCSVPAATKKRMPEAFSSKSE
jgi:hypothetical protein